MWSGREQAGEERAAGELSIVVMIVWEQGSAVAAATVGSEVGASLAVVAAGCAVAAVRTAPGAGTSVALRTGGNLISIPLVFRDGRWVAAYPLRKQHVRLRNGERQLRQAVVVRWVVGFGLRRTPIRGMWGVSRHVVLGGVLRRERRWGGFNARD